MIKFDSPFDKPIQRDDKYDPDASPMAWVYYEIVYSNGNGIIKLGGTEFNSENLSYYNSCNADFKERSYRYYDTDDHCYRWLNYKNDEIPEENRYDGNRKKYNRLFALKADTKRAENPKDKKEYCDAASRVGGECDFNFNEGKKTLFEEIIKNDSNAAEESKNEALEKLDECAKMHHNLLNFSLMQAMGNLQRVKGRDKFDRFDTFVWKLSEYYSIEKEQRLAKDPAVLKKATKDENKNDLIQYLDGFVNIYDYCRQVYFLDDEKFVNEVIAQGQRPINNCIDVIRYMTLAEEFWKKKYDYVKEKYKPSNKQGDNP